MILISCNSEDLEKTDYVFIPDREFERHLISNGYDTEQKYDNRILLADAENVESLGISGRAHIDEGISDLTGLEYFKNLKSFVSSNQTIRSFDFSLNEKLELIRIVVSDIDEIILPIKSSLNYFEFVPYYQEKALTIDFSTSEKLTEILLSDIFEINLQNNLNLKKIGLVNINNRTELELKNFINLSHLRIWNCSFSELDVSENINLEFLDVEYNTNFSCIKVGENQNFEAKISDSQYLSTTCE